MLKIRQSDGSKFEVGVNLAATPGKVVFRNHLIELIQYAPTTAEVLARPLLIVPPWINKFYILDLNPDKSFIRWCVDEGHTVFTISWVNPDERHRDCGFESYMRDGVFAAIDAIRNQTGETRVNALGYCVGGTLLASTLGYMAATRDSRIAAATFLTTQVDFSNSGDLQVFADEEQIAAVEAEMAEKGYLEGGKMAMAFNMLRPNDLIWSYMVSNYVKGAEPHAFDLLYWNSDSTNMPAKNHSFYMRQCYLHDNIVKGKMVLDGKRINLSKVKTPIYNLAAREDHIAPAASVFKGCRAFGSKVDYVLAGSGHIAGVVNPPAAGKYQYWTGGKAEGELKDWLAAATEHPGSWWPHWSNWLRRQAPSLAKARNPDKGKLKPLGDAPGEFVKKLS
jgi:polyhydroxyalkanoate synthase